MKIIKFGKKSLANGKSLDTVLEILNKKISEGEEMVVVTSSRNNTLIELDHILERAKNHKDYQK